MKLVLSDTKLFKQSIDAMVDLIKDTEFLISEYGISLKAIDAGQIAMIIYNLPRDAFETFEIEGTKKIGVNLPSLASIMKRARANDKLILELGDNKRLKITFEGENVRSFSINLLDISATDLPNPDINYDAVVRMNANALSDGVKDANLFATYLTFKATKKFLEISAKGPQGEIDNKTEYDSPLIKETEVKGEAIAMYSIEYLQHLLKGSSPDTDVEINLKTNSPLKLRYNIGVATIQFFLAPRDFE